MRTRAVALPLILLVCARSAAAQEPLPVGKSFAAGAATAIVPFFVGGMLLSREGGLADPGAAVTLVSAGLILAPLAAHAGVREWKRGLVFSGLAALPGLATILLTTENPDLLDQGRMATRVPFAILATLTLAASGVGVADSLFAQDRALVPLVGQDLVGLALGGRFP